MLAPGVVRSSTGGSGIPKRKHLNLERLPSHLQRIKETPSKSEPSPYARTTSDILAVHKKNANRILDLFCGDRWRAQMQLRKRYLLGNSVETELGAPMVGCGRVQGDRNRGRIELENTLPRFYTNHCQRRSPRKKEAREEGSGRDTSVALNATHRL